MTKKKNPSPLAGYNFQPRKLSGLSFLLLSFALACTEDEKIEPSPVGDISVTSQKGSPASFISQSEKLEILTEVNLPANLPNGNMRVATYFAAGVQKYKAQEKAGSDPVAYEWVFVAPSANLYDKTSS